MALVLQLSARSSRRVASWRRNFFRQPKNKFCLICIDGWGISTKEDTAGDAIRNAQHPVMAGFAKEYPNSVTELEAHGLFVGLPEGLMGNSEVGHLNIGAGRVVYQVGIAWSLGTVEVPEQELTE